MPESAAVTPPPDAPRPVSRLGAAFTALWIGESVSLLGNATASVFVPLVAVVELDATPTWMGLLTACVWLPWLVVGLPAGAWVDQRQPRTVMIAADVVAALSAASVPCAWYLGVLTLPHLLAAAFVTGTCTVFFRAAYPRLVRAVSLGADGARAYGRLDGTQSFMQVAGPGAAGAMLTVVSAASGLLLDAVSFLVSAFFLRRMPSLPLSTARPERLRTRIASGLRTTAHDPFLRFSVAMGGASNFGLTGYQTLLVLFLVRDLHLDGGRVGLTLAVGAVGGVAGALLAPRIRRRVGASAALRRLQVAGGPIALLIPLAGWVGGAYAVPLVILGLLGVGFGVVGGNVVRSAFTLDYVPDEIRGRLVTSGNVIGFGTMPVAALVAGLLATKFGVVAATAVMTTIHAAACLAVLVGPYRAGRDLPTGTVTIR